MNNDLIFMFGFILGGILIVSRINIVIGVLILIVMAYMAFPQAFVF